jgi:MFS family permease
MSANATITAAPAAADRTRWGYVALLLAGGVGAAMQVGKVPPALALLQHELHASIVAAAWIISLFSVIGASCGCLAGSVADLLGARRAAAIGLACMAAASFVGGHATSIAMLLASRAAEGMAFVIVVVAIPSLLLASACEHDRRFVPALWGTYMPIGTAIALAVSPAILRMWGWRGSWELNALILLSLAIALLLARAPVLASHHGALPTLARLRAVLLHRGPLLLGLVFSCYTFQYVSIMGFLPTILQQQGFAAQSAGNLTAVAVLANAAGNLLASALIARHSTPRRLIAWACVGMALSIIGIYDAALGSAARYAFILAFFAVAGLVPASVFASVPVLAHGRGSTATTMGFVVQASHAGQLLGPPAVAAVAAAVGGWQLSALVLVPAALLALTAALLSRIPR